jgi:hypothetical protein
VNHTTTALTNHAAAAPEKVHCEQFMSNEKRGDAPGQNKEFTIIVNARQKQWAKKEISFNEVVNLAFGAPNYETSVYTVTYQKGEDKKPKGSLTLGDSVHVKEGMIFDVIRTNKS